MPQYNRKRDSKANPSRSEAKAAGNSRARFNRANPVKGIEAGTHAANVNDHLRNVKGEPEVIALKLYADDAGKWSGIAQYADAKGDPNTFMQDKGSRMQFSDAAVQALAESKDVYLAAKADPEGNAKQIVALVNTTSDYIRESQEQRPVLKADEIQPFTADQKKQLKGLGFDLKNSSMENFSEGWKGIAASVDAIGAAQRAEVSNTLKASLGSRLEVAPAEPEGIDEAVDSVEIAGPEAEAEIQ